MTQKKRLLAALERGPITTYQAVIRLGILCPWKRIQELRADGHQIVSDPLTRQTRDGVVRIVQYRLDRQGRLPL